ncbi:YidB family protein [Falsiroseomonas sp. E2-1-a20]|uniref:YidB family protein n=1 Tax=Falsiroseomonas sp. E2-1-a20 TaxID=3239300 RepID=UPI003F302F10
MSRGFPSMTALLGVLAIAGYQNRDKISEMLAGATGGSGGAARAPGQPDQGGIGNILSGGLRDLVDRFRQTGDGDTADSWVAQGPNRELAPDQLERAVGADTLDELAKQTGLSRAEILARLTRDLPGTVDHYTPDGRLPG